MRFTIAALFDPLQGTDITNGRYTIHDKLIAVLPVDYYLYVCSAPPTDFGAAEFRFRVGDSTRLARSKTFFRKALKIYLYFGSCTAVKGNILIPFSRNIPRSGNPYLTACNHVWNFRMPLVRDRSPQSSVVGLRCPT